MLPLLLHAPGTGLFTKAVYVRSRNSQQDAGRVRPSEDHAWSHLTPRSDGRLALNLRQGTRDCWKGEEPTFGCHVPYPKLFKFSRCEGNIKTVQRVLNVPSSKNAVALIIGFYEILQCEEMTFSNIQCVYGGIRMFKGDYLEQSKISRPFLPPRPPA